MAALSVIATTTTTTSLLALFVVFCFPLVHSLSTVAISETGNQTLVCALTGNASSSSLSCTSFPQGIQVPVVHPFQSISGIVGGDGFLCALSSVNPSSNSTMMCWRFSIFGNNTEYKRIYIGPFVKDLDSGNSRICGLVVVNGSSSLECWQWKGRNFTASLSSSLAVGDNFVCGLSDSKQVRCAGSTTITALAPSGNFSQVDAGSNHACAISVNGSLQCWGSVAAEVTEVPQGQFKSIALGENRSCAIRSDDDTVSCWGGNGFSLPESLRNESFIALEAKRSVFCGVTRSNYSLLCWGSQDFDLNSLVFGGVAPGPCRAANECACGQLPGDARYCPRDLRICQACSPQPGGPNLQPPASPPATVPTPPVKRTNKWDRKMVAFMIVGCVGSSLFLVGLCVFLFPRYIKIRSTRIHDSGRLEEGDGSQHSGEMGETRSSSRRRPLEKRLSHLISMGNGGHLEEFSLEVLLKATENFSEEHKIGTGSFGSVYHATLEDEREVAIKRAENTPSSSYAGATKRGLEDKDSAFLNELEFLSRLNHKNLVRLLGYCEEGVERVLIYEYMDNGTLFDHLHKLESSPLMSWPTRIKVALDAARGIQYLHEYAMPRIIHRDIKSSNILLDGTWTAKVSDFGLSLKGPQDDEACLSLRAAGTMGYMDPEYYRLQLLTTKSDVYSFGIVLLELLSGCKAIHKNENGVPRNVVDYVVPYIIQDEVHRVLDRRVPPPTPFEIEAVAYVGYLAADCVMPEGRDRPPMNEVVYSLDRALEACLAPQVLSRSSSTGSSR